MKKFTLKALIKEETIRKFYRLASELERVSEGEICDIDELTDEALEHYVIYKIKEFNSMGAGLNAPYIQHNIKLEER